MSISSPKVIAGDLPDGHVQVAFTAERGRVHGDDSVVFDGTVALGGGCLAGLTVSVAPELMDAAGDLLKAPGKTVMLAIKPLRPGSRTVRATAVLESGVGTR